MSIFRKKAATTATTAEHTTHGAPHHHEREHTMTIDAPIAPVGAALDAATEADLQQKAKDHLWMHFARQSGMEAGNGVPIIVRGEGHHVYDSHGKKYIDGLSGLFVVQVGHGRERLELRPVEHGRHQSVYVSVDDVAETGSARRR